MVLFFVILSSFLICAFADTPPSKPSKSNAPISASMLDCFAPSPGRALSNAMPSHESFNVSPDDCLRFCFAERMCNTIVYHKHFSTCQLYAGAKEGEAAQEVIARGHDLYTKKKCGVEKRAVQDGKTKEEEKKN